ncbi:MAG: Gfo/Idh/MocA family protein [Candidatus Zipacnadales bacterium]
MASSERWNRRHFLGTSVAGAVALGTARRGTPAGGQVLGANDRIHMAVIGCGGMGTNHLRRLVDRSKRPEEKLKVVAVCDVYEPRRERAKAISNGEAYLHYGEVLERPDVDAVLIATPDHWHAKISIDALEAGKDVYCEKPMTLYWHEAKQVAEVVRRTGRVFQCGVQSTSDDIWWQANRLIREGAIGKLTWSQSGYCRNSRGGEWNYNIESQCTPDTLDWNLWLGPAPKRPFDPERFFRFRKYWDYSGGVATDLLFHALGHMAIALGPEFPESVSAEGGIYVQHDREVPDTYHTTIRYPSGHTLVMASSMCNRQAWPEIIRGHEATMYFEPPGIVIRPEEEYKDQRPELTVAPEPRADHMTNFLECVRTRAKPHCNAEVAYRVCVAIALGVMSYREGRVIKFDPVKEEVIN